MAREKAHRARAAVVGASVRRDVPALAARRFSLLTVWGVAYGAVRVCSRIWFADASPDTPEASSVLFTASFQAAISVGALVGGIALDRSSPSAVVLVGAATAAFVVLITAGHRGSGTVRMPA
ncbi:hypothetical protein [Streptomyces niveus]|uniref:hypothetical protein n=1 Tax=Streptomyces niveus TaxID=193462 RepID=UPI003F5414EC